MPEQVAVLFVCLGNICRSPAAESIFRQLAAAQGLEARLRVDSAGTSAYHEGEAPDGRMQRAAKVRGYDLSHQRARQLRVEDAAKFDYLIVMDADNEREVLARFPGSEAKVRRLLEFAPDTGLREVPDPYYGGAHGFEQVLGLLEAGCRGLLAHLGDNELAA